VSEAIQFLSVTVAMAFGSTAAAAAPRVVALTEDAVTVELSVRDESMRVVVPVTAKAKSAGMQARHVMKDQGYLVQYTGKTGQCMNLRGLGKSVNVAFIEKDRRIANFAVVEAKSKANHCGVQPRWAVVMPGDWFAAKGVQVKDVVQGIDADFDALAAAERERRKRK
jgi:uncharacterized membrane protein (UPF0127 family)